MRLQKFLSAAGVCSRRKGEEYIRQGIVFVNGAAVTEPGVKVDPEKDRVTVSGKPVSLETKTVYIALNKPAGYITSCSHGREKIVLDLIDIPERVYPVGRLDKDSKGLLLLTNDGELHHRLSHPSFDHEKEYFVRVKQRISDRDLNRMREGMVITGRKTRPAQVKRSSSTSFVITLKEGRNRQIRRMVEKVGNQVVVLKRIRMSGIKLGDLPEGAWRSLTKKEEQLLKQA